MKVFIAIHRSSLNFASNIERYCANQLTFIPPEIIRKPMVTKNFLEEFSGISEGIEVIRLISLTIRSEIW